MGERTWAEEMAELIATLPDPRIVCNEDGVSNYCIHDEHAVCYSYCLCRTCPCGAWWNYSLQGETYRGSGMYVRFCYHCWTETLRF